MLILGLESSCDETGIALYDTQRGLLAQALHSQVDLHAVHGGVVPELAARDHIQRGLPLLKQVLQDANVLPASIDAIAFTQGPGLAGALLVGAGLANSLALAWNKPVIGIHHLEGHLLSPLIDAPPALLFAPPSEASLPSSHSCAPGSTPSFPFVALLVSGGHTQLMHVEEVGRYTLLGETLDDAAGEAFDKTAKLIGLGYPGGAALSELALQGRAGAVVLPRPMLHSGNLDFSFSGLKTAVLTQVRRHCAPLTLSERADLARGFVDAAVEVLVSKSLKALEQTGLKQLVVAGGVGANMQLRQALHAATQAVGKTVHYPAPELCTDNGAMIAFAGALRLHRWPEQAHTHYAFTVKPRWELSEA